MAMNTVQGYYNSGLKHSKYVADIIGLTDNKTLHYFLKLLRDDSMCESLEATSSYGLIFTKQTITKCLFASCSIYIIHRATKSAVSEINKRYMRAHHWFKIHAWSSTHPELFILVPLHSLLSPFIYFHYLFKFSWYILCSHHKRTIHSKNTNYNISKRRMLFKIGSVLIASYVYWVPFTNWTARQLFNRNLSFHSWSTRKALNCIDIEEERWIKAIYIMLNEHFEQINTLPDIVLQFIGRSDVYRGQQEQLLRSNHWNEYTYSTSRQRKFRQECGNTFNTYKHLISSCFLSAQCVSYVMLLWKIIRCEHNICENYYDKLDDWHNQFGDGYDNEEWMMEKWSKRMIVSLWRYLFVDHRMLFAKHIVSVVEYVMNRYHNSMDQSNKRFLRDNYFLACMCVFWSRINYLVVEEMSHTYQY